MRKPITILLLSLLITLHLFAGGYDVGNVAVVPDTTNSISAMSMGPICVEAGLQFYQNHDDIFDGIIVFTSVAAGMMNMQQGIFIQPTATNIGRDDAWPYGPASKYGSAGMLKQCARMTHIDWYPENPDDKIMFGLSAIELTAHEYSHHWHVNLTFTNDELGANRDLLRGFENEEANQHWSYYFNTDSVMYGSIITDNGDGSFSLNGGDRKFSQFDQYIMGLRPKDEVDPTFLLVTQTNADGPNSSSLPIPKDGGTVTVKDMKKIDIAIDDIIASMGERIPAYADAQHDFRIAFKFWEYRSHSKRKCV